MKNTVYFMFIVLLTAACSNDDNNKVQVLTMRMAYDCADNTAAASAKSTAIRAESFDDRYTQFGDYIASITPTIFIGKFLGMEIANWDMDATESNFQFTLIDNNSDVTSPTRLADFSDNASVDMDLHGIQKGEFNLFYFTPMFFYQELELSFQYDTVSYLDNINYPNSSIDLNSDAVGGIRNGRSVKGNNGTFISPVYNSSGLDYSQIPKFYVFGSTETTYEFYGDGTTSIDNPGGQECRIIRSKAFTNIVIEEAEDADTNIINGKLSFYTDNLIQIYAGNDNKPYTRDDIFVYAPNFWERLSVTMSAEQK